MVESGLLEPGRDTLLAKVPIEGLHFFMIQAVAAVLLGFGSYLRLEGRMNTGWYEAGSFILGLVMFISAILGIWVIRRE